MRTKSAMEVVAEDAQGKLNERKDSELLMDIIAKMSLLDGERRRRIIHAVMEFYNISDRG